MKKSSIIRRRGTSLAAAALSLALVAPFAQPVAVAQEAPAAVAGAADASLEDAVAAGVQVIDADPIASGRVTRGSHLTNIAGQGYGLLSGHVVEATPDASAAANPYTAGGTGGIHAPDGTYVYAQFRDTDGSVSPIYRTQVHTLDSVTGLNGGPGTFAFGLPEVEVPEIEVPEVTADPETDPELYEQQVKAAEEASNANAEASNVQRSVSGVKRRGGMEWTDANGNVHRFHAAIGQQYRLWVDPYVNERGQLVEPFRQINGVTPGSFIGTSTNQNNGAWPNVNMSQALTGMVMKERPADWMVGPDSALMAKAVQDEEGARSNPDVLTDLDRYIAGKVWLEAGNGTSIVNAPNQDRSDRPAAGYRVYASTLTREGAIANEAIKKLDDPAERTAATKKMLEDHPEYILKTVWGYTDEEGRYTLRFDDKDNSSTEETDYWDPNNMFMWVTDPTGEKLLTTYSPYITNSFYHFNDNEAWSPGTPYWRPVRKAVNNAHFGVMLNELQSLDITNFDATANPASQGDTAEIDVTGTLPPFDEESNWVQVVWRGSESGELKRCENIGTVTEASKCSLEIPDTAVDGEIITAELVIGGRVVSADTLIVRDQEKNNGQFTPEYTETPVEQGKEETVPAPKNTQPDANGDVQPLPDGTTFTPGNVVVGPEGPLEDADGNPQWPDWITVNEDGTITVAPKEDTPVGDYQVPVVVTYPDGTKETVYSTVKVVPDYAPEYEGDYTPKTDDEALNKGAGTLAPAGETATADVSYPENKAPGDGVASYTKQDGFTDPDGYTIDVDPETGEVSVKVDPAGENGPRAEVVEVPVTVTYNDGAKDDTATAVFYLDTDGDGIPDVDDEDDDNDGSTDEEEKEAGTDPKDPNSKPETPVVPDASVVTDPETVVEGQPSDPFDTAKDVPEGGKVEVENLPGGLEVDPETGKVTGTPDKLDDWGKDEEERDVKVTVTITDADGNEVAKEDKVITVQRDTDGDGIPDVKDEDDDNDGVSDEDEKKAGTDPKDPNSKPGAGVEDTTPPTVDPVAPGDKEVSGKGDRPNEDITVTFPDGSTEKTTTDEDGNWKVDVPSDVELNPGDEVVVTDGDGNEAKVTVEDTTPPSINEVKPGDKTVTGKGDRPNEEITVTFPGGKTVTTTTDENGNWKVNVPSGVELNTGDKVTATDGAGNKATAQVGIDAGKCAATAVGFGLPLLALIPIGLATQMQIPGLSDFAAQANAQIQAANTQIQQQAGLFNPQLAAQVDAVNQQLGKFGADLGTVAGGLALIAAGILAGTLIYDNCSPNGGSSVKDLELKGSSGKTYAGSSQKEQEKAGSSNEDKSSKQQEGSSEKK